MDLSLFQRSKKPEKKHFDLNIDKILENWEPKHAVREIIANALDEQALTGSAEMRIFKDGDTWVIRDYGRGLRTENLIQTENKEKLDTLGLIGKFGIGLKDALATFERHGIEVNVTSKHVSISIERTHKSGFENIVTLHATIEPPKANLIGTEFRLRNLSDTEVEEAKKLFLKFNNGTLLEKNRFGEVYDKTGEKGLIYINGVQVAEEPNFLFSYNITNIDSVLRKAINRERSNVGRTAYASVIRRILLSCNSEKVGELLSNDLSNFSSGHNHDELKWIDVQTHAAQIMASRKNVVFVTSTEIKEHTDLVNEAGSNDRTVVVIPDNLTKKIEEANTAATTDERPKLTTLTEFTKQRSENFEFKFVELSSLSPEERANFFLIGRTFQLLGGKPEEIKTVRISENMQKDTATFMPCDGLWDPKDRVIIIHRKILKDRSRFLGVLLHEIAHAKSGCSDATRGFESELTQMLGILAKELYTKPQS